MARFKQAAYLAVILGSVFFMLACKGAGRSHLTDVVSAARSEDGNYFSLDVDQSDHKYFHSIAMAALQTSMASHTYLNQRLAGQDNTEIFFGLKNVFKVKCNESHCTVAFSATSSGPLSEYRFRSLQRGPNRPPLTIRPLQAAGLIDGGAFKLNFVPYAEGVTDPELKRDILAGDEASQKLCKMFEEVHSRHADLGLCKIDQNRRTICGLAVPSDPGSFALSCQGQQFHGQFVGVLEASTNGQRWVPDPRGIRP